MRTEKEKMLAEVPYNSADPQLVEERLRARELCQQLNTLSPRAPETERQALVSSLFGANTSAYVTPPFQCDYGANIVMGAGVYFNFNCVVLDVARVFIGNNVLFGPAVQIYTATHPMDAVQRRSGIESGKTIRIGNDVWVGGAAVICPGVTIGDGAIIGAGSVVVKDIPPGVFAAGNPCTVIRTLYSSSIGASLD
ncbi:sugar O-acetyltransferase [Massilia sp. RP-1-19]|uniref:Acetyltransferase n=1 Tax=Massilia polaris TaxID=2728846 RepID=A0A848HTR6_9BURK|nr:sugar O-acetyltransferase [Massilia polaris]NML63439.1 sugar O-acetyltransferase [Massilia polaris]